MKIFNKVVCVSLVLSSILLLGCTKKSLPIEKPKDFNLTFSYGVEGKNKLDTSKGTFTKDMITEPSVTTNMKLTEEELELIYSKMREINILEYDDKFEEKNSKLQTPYYTYNLKFNFDGIEKNIYWEDKSNSDSEDAKKLRDFFGEIQKLIESKEEYIKLPEATGGYQ